MWIFSLVFPSPVVPAFLLLPSTFKLATERGRKKERKKGRRRRRREFLKRRSISKGKIYLERNFEKSRFPRRGCRSRPSRSPPRLPFPFSFPDTGIFPFSFAGVLSAAVSVASAAAAPPSPSPLLLLRCSRFSPPPLSSAAADMPSM